MKWKPRKPLLWATEWHQWFAWRPIQLKDESRIWLQFIWRRAHYPWGSLEWEYSEVFMGERRKRKSR